MTLGNDMNNFGVVLGYLVSQYPAVNHTFILREIRTLRRLGFDIRVVSIRTADRPIHALSEDESDEQRQTFSILGSSLPHIITTHIRVFFRNH